MTARTTPAWPALVLTAALALTGCTDKTNPDTTGSTGPTQTTTPAPTTEPPVDPLQTSPDEARNAYLNYVDVRNQVLQDHYRDWDSRYLDLATGEERTAVVSNAGTLAEAGYYMQGNIVVKTIPQVLVYEDTDPGGNYRAEMKACVDTSGAQWVAEGRDTFRASPDGRFYSTIVMQRVVSYGAEGNVVQDPHGQGWWRVASEHGNPEQPC